jgi:hypothetical protein
MAGLRQKRYDEHLQHYSLSVALIATSLDEQGGELRIY